MQPVATIDTLLASGQPALPGMDWQRLATTPIVLLGAGAIGRPLADSLAFLGSRDFLVVDPKAYRSRSVVSQCELDEVGQFKAAIVARRLEQRGVGARGLVADVFDIAPGQVGPEAILVVSADNRRADIGANRLAAMMRTRLVKVNVEPLLLAASIRCYDLRSEAPELCLECQMSEAQYAEQRHPASCDGDDGSRPTGSPRALCRLAADAAALVIAQLAGSPEKLATRWYGRQWLLNMLTGQATLSGLGPNPACRWEHGKHWPNLQRLTTGPQQMSLADLLTITGLPDRAGVRVRLSARVATQGHCPRCGPVKLFRWLERLSDSPGKCDCGGELTAVPFFTFAQLPGSDIPCWDMPLADWGVPAHAAIAFEATDRAHSFVIGADSGEERHGL